MLRHAYQMLRADVTVAPSTEGQIQWSGIRLLYIVAVLDIFVAEEC